jgi:hypothetical protein
MGFVPIGMLELWNIGKMGFGNRDVGYWQLLSLRKIIME